MFLLIKIPIVIIFINWMYHSYNGLEFNLIDQIEVILAYTFYAYVAYIICSIPFGGLNTSPLLIRDEITKKIKESYSQIGLHEGVRGVYTLRTLSVVEEKVVYTYDPVSNPIIIIGEIKSDLRTLRVIDSMESNRLTTRLELLDNELNYMIDHPDKIKVHIK